MSERFGMINLPQKPDAITFLKFFNVLLIISFLFYINAYYHYLLQSIPPILFLIQGALEGILCIILSTILLNFYKFKTSIIIGVIGIILIAINFIFNIIYLSSFEFPYVPSYNIIYIGVLYMKETGLILIYIGLCINYAALFIALFIIDIPSTTLIIKKTILALSTRYSKLKIKEIREKCHKRPDLIVKVLQEMIENEEVYGEYFRSSKSLVFDLEGNSKEIDDLMEKYKNWENNMLSKKY